MDTYIVYDPKSLMVIDFGSATRMMLVNAAHRGSHLVSQHVYDTLVCPQISFCL